MRAGRYSDIRLGEPLPQSLYDAAGNLLLGAGAVVATSEQRQRLVNRGFVMPDDPSPRLSPGDLPADVREPVFDSVRDLARRVQVLHNQLLDGSTRDFPEAMAALVGRLDGLAARDTDAALASMHLYALEAGLGVRLVHAAVLCRVFGAALGLDPAQMRSSLAAALTYDVALTSIADTLNHQNAPLSPAQREAIDQHPEAACRLLRDAGVDDAVWLGAVLEHHERVDGSGYPGKLAGDAISLPGRMLGIVDSFSAMVRPRAYRDAVLSRQALRDIFLARSKSVDERLAHVFVREIGMYPPGSLVRLANGEGAVVVRRGEDAVHPQVRVVLYPDNSRSLSHPVRDTRQAEFQITEGLPLHAHPAILPSLARLWTQD